MPPPKLYCLVVQLLLSLGQSHTCELHMAPVLASSKETPEGLRDTWRVRDFTDPALTSAFQQVESAGRGKTAHIQKGRSFSERNSANQWGRKGKSIPSFWRKL